MSGTAYPNELVVPSDATSLEGFRRWIRTMGGRSPKVHFIDGDLWFDMTPQSYHSHLPVSTEVNGVLASLVREMDVGRYYADGGWITDAASRLSTQPDGFLLLWETLRRGAARLAEGSEIELEGCPDMVLEVVSKMSVKKDTQVLRRKYADLGVREFWLVDALHQELGFQLLVLGHEGYATAESDADGFRASPVWGKAFRLRRVQDRLGQPDYRLDVR